ncbi:Glucan endo-1,3-alpha-glucosidase agn1 [Aspergillus niger]
MALLGGGTRRVQVGNGAYTQFVTWDSMPDDEIGAGVYFGSVPLREGDVTIQLMINEDEGLGDAKDLAPFKSFGEPVKTTGVALSDQVCIRGKGAYDFEDLCKFTCSYGYCPVGACTCEQMGVARTKPNATGITGYPAEGRDANYAGLCSFACNYCHCPSKTWDTAEHVMSIPTVSDCLPPACTEGTGQGNFAGLCSYSCSYGYCPRSLCTCTATGPLVQPPAQTKGHGIPALGLDGGNGFTNLCDFTYRGYCPTGACRYKDEEISTATINPL